MKIVDLAKIIGPDCTQSIVGIRSGEKLHEVMISADDARETIEFNNFFIVVPSGKGIIHDHYVGKGGKPCSGDFYYGSDNNTQWVTENELAEIISGLDLPEVKQWIEERRLKR